MAHTTDRDHDAAALHVVAEPTPPVDPDEELLRQVRLDPSSQLEAVVKVPITLQVRKPPKQEFIRTHPDQELLVRAIELKDGIDAEFYLVAGPMVAELQEESASFCLRPYINQARTLRLWPIRLPDPDGRVNEWHRTADIAAAHARKKWVRITANRDLGGYECFEAVKQRPEPDWPALTLPDIIRLAFKAQGKIIDSADHPLVKQLQGRL